MGLAYAEIEIMNGYDVESARLCKIGIEEIKRMNVSFLVDTGSALLCINENIQDVLQLPVDGKQKAQTADGTIIECDIVSLVKLRFQNRQTTCRAMVLPGDSEPLLGAIPLEDMDVIIHPKRNELIVHPDHPDCAQVRI